ncbi:unnamed protein product [Paramecium pentaurelia]|uniref:Uncharacterized protein n=1 Tax=Paramecium pentaurelia TaxID=43138 RepID=A0A8S1UBW0_9CILI|nr:unnamed protein product [Paramecium pentaurelia]
MDSSPLFQSLQKKSHLFSQNKVNFSSLHRLNFLTLFIEKYNSIYNENLIQQLISSLSQNQSYNSNLNLLNSLILLLSNESLIKFNINNQLKQVINKCFKNIKFVDFKSTIYQQKYFWIGFYSLQYQENKILPYLTSQQILIKILSKYDNASAFFNRLRSYEHPKPYVFISLFQNINHKYEYLIPQEKYKKLRNMLKSIIQTKDRMDIYNKLIYFILIMNKNIIEEINDLHKIHIQDYIQQYHNIIEVDLQKNITRKSDYIQIRILIAD